MSSESRNPQAGILIVDDDDIVLKATRRMVQKLGYSPLVAATGEEAVRIFRENMANINAVILDLVLPGMNGREVYLKLRELKPDVRVIISSGYSNDDSASDLIAAGYCLVINKPYRLNDLARIIEEAVGPAA